MSRRLRTSVARLGVSGATLVLCLAIVEVSVRLVAPQGDVFKRTHPELFIHYAPGTRGIFVSRLQPDIRTPIQINSLGYRGPELDLGSDPRLVFIGDSYTVGMEVREDETFVRRTEALVRARHPTAAAFNLGLGGSGTGLQLHHFRARGLGLQPTIAILQLTVSNDFVDNSASLDWKRYVPHWRPAPGGGVTMVAPEVTVPPTMNLARRSQAAAWAYQRYRSFRMRGKKPGREPCWSHPLYRERPPPEWSEAYETTLGLVGSFARLCDERGIVPLVLVVPSGCQLDGHEAIPRGFDLFRPQREVARILGPAGTLVDLTSPIRAETLRRDDPHWFRFEDDWHFNPDGHHFVARLLAREILDLLGRPTPARRDDEVNHERP